MTISSFNEWDKLREIVVGSATNANWPTTDPVFTSQTTTWTETPIPQGPVPQWIVDETNEDLDTLADTLKQAGVIVHRPTDFDFITWDGMYNYCPRDRFLVAGTKIVDPAMMYPSRDIEVLSYNDVLSQATELIYMPREQGMTLDAANICRLNNTWLYLESVSGNKKAYDWLCAFFPEIKIELCNFYSGVHVDSTIIPLREGYAVVNGSRVNPSNLPDALKDWTIMYVQNVFEQSFYQYPYSSKWIGINMLSIDPQTVIVDKNQPIIIQGLEAAGFTVVPLELRHSRTLGGGFHCVTLDLHRD